MNYINEYAHSEEMDRCAELYNPNRDVYQDNLDIHVNQLNGKNDENCDPWNSRGIRVINIADIRISELTETIALNPNDIENYIKRASFYEARGKQEEAIVDYSETIRLKPDYADAYLKRSLCHKKIGLHNEAISDFNEVIRLNPMYIGLAVLYGFITKTVAVDVI